MTSSLVGTWCEIRVVFLLYLHGVSGHNHFHEVSAAVSGVTVERHFSVQLGLVKEVKECGEHQVSIRESSNLPPLCSSNSMSKRCFEAGR